MTRHPKKRQRSHLVYLSAEDLRRFQVKDNRSFKTHKKDLSIRCKKNA